MAGSQPRYFLSFVQILFLQHLVSLTCMTDWVLKEQPLTKGFGIYIKTVGNKCVTFCSEHYERVLEYQSKKEVKTFY
jgi:hypothetical protein